MDLANLYVMRMVALVPLCALVFASGLRAQAKLDTTQFVVLGEGLAAGMSDFALRDINQEKSFPAQMARQMKTAFPQPLIEAPGIGNAPGFTTLPTMLPGTGQGAVRATFPPGLFVFNLSIPGHRLADAMTARPSPPLLQPRNQQQTVVNLILGYPALIVGRSKPLLTQSEYALAMNPTLLLVELGYYEVLEAAVKDDPSLLPDVTTFKNNYTALLTRLKSTYAEMVVMTVPDPFDTAFFTTVQSATDYVGTPPAELQKIFRLNQTDLLTPFGMMLVGNLILADNVGQLLNPLFPGLASFFPGTVVKASTKTAVTNRVTALNTEITTAAQAAGAKVYDLRSFFARVKAQGLTVNGKRLTANMLGGFYSLNGYYPGAVGHGAIANEVLQLLNTTYKTNFPLLDLGRIAEDDPAGRFTPAAVVGRPHTEATR